MSHALGDCIIMLGIASLVFLASKVFGGGKPRIILCLIDNNSSE
jgi:hypothetical protein